MDYITEDRGYCTPCWVFRGHLDRDGYGKIGSATGRGFLAHRIAYERRHGAIRPDHEIDHLCRVRECVNPDHLEVVPHKINTWRSSNTKLSYEIACDVRDDFARWNGTTVAFCREWAPRLGVCVQNVYKIVSGHSWTLPEGW